MDDKTKAFDKAESGAFFVFLLGEKKKAERKEIW